MPSGADAIILLKNYKIWKRETVSFSVQALGRQLQLAATARRMHQPVED